MIVNIILVIIKVVMIVIIIIVVILIVVIIIVVIIIVIIIIGLNQAVSVGAMLVGRLGVPEPRCLEGGHYQYAGTICRVIHKLSLT